MSGPRSDRTTLRRGTARAVYDGRMLTILDAGLVAHVGVTTPDGPVVLPMAYARDDDHLYLHGATGNALLRHAIDTDVCVTVTIVDGLVVARSPFHNSMNYRSVVVRGPAAAVEDVETKREVLRRVSDHVVPTWATGRTPTDAELRRTLVLQVSLEEMSGKVRTGGPNDEPPDVSGPHWAGHVPLHVSWSAPVDADDLAPGIEPPPAITDLEDRELREADAP